MILVRFQLHCVIEWSLSILIATRLIKKSKLLKNISFLKRLKNTDCKARKLALRKVQLNYSLKNTHVKRVCGILDERLPRFCVKWQNKFCKTTRKKSKSRLRIYQIIWIKLCLNLKMQVKLRKSDLSMDLLGQALEAMF